MNDSTEQGQPLVGYIHELTVFRENNSGYYLDSGDFGEDIFMPPSLGPLQVSVGDKIKVFVYVDQSGSLLATTRLPVACLHQFGLMRVVETRSFGAFFDWGIDKDLLVPEDDLRLPVRINEQHIVRVCMDESTEKLYGTTKINKFIQNTDFKIEVGEKVEILVAIKEAIGFRCIINKEYIGMIYNTEIFEDLKIGETKSAVVKKIRDDGLVDLSLQSLGIKNLVNSKDKILNYLKAKGGESPLCDKSSPELIKAELAMSKKTFKNTIGILYKERKILLSKEGIKLNS